MRAPVRSSVSTATSTSRNPAVVTRRSSSSRSRIGSSSRAAARCASAGGSPRVAAIASTAARVAATWPSKAARSANPRPRAKSVPRLVRRRQPVPLGAGRHLHPVLEPPPKAIGVEQGLRLAIAEQTGHHQAWQGARRVALAEIRPLAGVQELQRLHHHLHVADSARAELDVEAGVAERTRRVGRIAEQRTQPPHLFDHPGLDAARVDERIERGEQLVAERAIAGRRAGAQPGLPLPGSSERLVVALRRRQRVADRPAPPLGPQPQVDPEDHPVGGRLFDRRGHPA